MPSPADPLLPGCSRIHADDMEEYQAGKYCCQNFLLLKNQFPVSNKKFTLQQPFRSRLVAGNTDELLEIGSKRVCQWLIVMRIVGDRITMRIGERPHTVGFELQVKVFYPESINVFYPGLYSPFIHPGSIALFISDKINSSSSNWP